MKKQPYRLRGHHIRGLIIYHQFHDDYETYRKDMEEFCSDEPVNNEEGSEWDLNNLYDKSTLENFVALHKEITEDPDARIEVVEGNDDKCRLCCNEKKCRDVEMEADAMILKMYRLK